MKCTIKYNIKYYNYNISKEKIKKRLFFNKSLFTTYLIIKFVVISHY